MPNIVQDVNIKLNIVPGNVRMPNVGGGGPGGGGPQASQIVTPQVVKGLGLPGGGGAAGAGGLGDLLGAGGGAGGLLGGLAEIAGPVAALAGLLGGLEKAFESFLAVVEKTVAIAQPGTFKLFTNALEDVAGVIGHTLAPVLRVFTQAVRLFGDVLATLLPSQSQMNALMQPFSELLDALRETLQELVPLLKPLIDLFVVLTKHLVKALTQILKWLLGGINTILKMLKIEPVALKSSVGAAARPTAYTSIAGLAEQARLAAFRGGTKEDVEAEQRDLLKEIRDALAGIASDVTNATRRGIAGALTGGPAAWPGMLEAVGEAIAGQR
jgi:hypothetical protein